MSSTRPGVPWSLAEARGAFLTATIGLVTLALSWWESSGLAKLKSETAWGDVGVLGLALIVFAAVVWVAAGRRAVRARCGELAVQIDEATAHLLFEIEPIDEVDRMVTVLGASRYHRADCQLVTGKTVTSLGQGESPPDGLSPCEICLA